MADTTAEPPGGAPGAAPANDLNEESHYFDFGTFYKKPEFCDRVFQLVILDESKTCAQAPPPAKKGRRAKEKEPEGEEIPVNSIVVAAKSAVLRAMLSNGMKESAKGAPIIIRVTEQEKAAFKEMLQFLYTGTLSPEFQAPATSMSSLVGLLLLGDKYEVPSFMGAVLKGVSERERAVSDSATLIEELPEVLERRPQVKQLVDEARAYVLKTFKDVTEKWASDEFKGLGLGVVKFLLQSEELEAESEEEIATKVAAWADNKPGTLTQLLPYIRFCCIRGEVLEKWMLFKHSNVGLIERALKVQAYSDERKRLEKGLVLCERSGVRKVHLELVENIRVGEEVVSVKTPSANWFGKTWSILVRKWIAAPEKEGEPERPPTVGLFLYFEEVVDGQETERSLTDKVQFRVYIRTWPDGLWALRATTLTTFSLEDGKGQKNWGFPDVLDLPWETAIKSSRFVGPTGAMVFKVVARRFSQAEN